MKSCLSESQWEFHRGAKVVVNGGVNNECLNLIPLKDTWEISSEPAFQPSTSGTEADTLRHRISEVSLNEYDGERCYLMNAVSEHNTGICYSCYRLCGITDCTLWSY